MNAPERGSQREVRLSNLFFLSLSACLICLLEARCSEPVELTPCWNVDDLRPGMKGHGLTVMKGTRIEKFSAEVLGVLKNTHPGRDLVLCRLAGLDLERSGVIAGMSGSPVYIDGKLLGAVAYAWPFGKDPIAGVTPFKQMHACVDSYERNDLAEDQQPRRVGLRDPLKIDGKDFDRVTISNAFDDARPAAADGLFMMPLRTPLASTGFTTHSLACLKKSLAGTGMVPMTGGSAAAGILDESKNVKLAAGGPLSVSLIRGDFDLSSIGTVTHIEGKRVYGWGHPFFSVGRCDFPMNTGYIHTIYPRQSVSFKMGSPIKDVGVINADVSTGIAGWLGREADLLPIRLHARRETGKTRTFNVEVVRHRSLFSALIYTCLTNSVDLEGELPEEMTADLKARIEIEGRAPIILQDTFSGASYSGGRAPQALFSQVVALVNTLEFNPYQPVRIERIECTTSIRPGRISADIEGVELDSDTFAPGETLRATVFVRPFNGTRQRVRVALPLPADLPEGSYRATVCDDLYNAKQTLRDDPTLANPLNLEQIYAALEVHTSVKRTSLVLRVPTQAVGLAVDGKALPNLPGSVVQILGSSRRTGFETISGALVARQPTRWVLAGSESIRFQVTKDKKVVSGQ
ncbi:MAG: SpoIVB peptidase S55 domain-containing protein [Gemmataceae bacterium]